MTADTPTLTRHRFDTRRRSLTVTQTTRITPNMLRLRLEGAALADFVSLSPDDHIKVFVPNGAGGAEPVMRDYTPRRFNAAAGWLEIDFALHQTGQDQTGQDQTGQDQTGQDQTGQDQTGHEVGLATLWALAARPGDRAEIGGPRGSQVITGPIGGWALIGDETALPAIARRIEEMPPSMPVTSLIAIPTPQDAQQIATPADHQPIWVTRADPTDPTALLAALEGLALAPQTFVWIAAEAGVARALRDAVLARGHAPQWLKAAGYWQSGAADAAVKDL